MVFLVQVERLKDQLKSAESAISSLRKKLYAKTRAESAETSSDFGSLDPPEGDFKIAPSSVGPGEWFRSMVPQSLLGSNFSNHISQILKAGTSRSFISVCVVDLVPCPTHPIT